MPKILSGAVLLQGNSSSFITLSQAQPALQVTPTTIDTTTGFLVIVNPSTVVEYTNVLGNITFDSGSLSNFNAGQDISIYQPGNGVFQVYTSTYLNSVSGVTDPTNATSPITGAFTVTGGVGIGKDLWLGGNLYFAQGLDNVLTGSRIVLTSTASNALSVAGGAIFTGTLYANGIYDNSTRVISTIKVGPGLSESTSTGPTVILTNTGVLSLTAGTGTLVSSTTGYVTVWVQPNIANQTLQQVTTNGNTTTNVVYFNNLTNTSATNSGSVIIAGGIGVAGNGVFGGTIYGNNLNVTNAVDSTIVANNGVFTNLQVTGTNYNTATLSNNALTVTGGVGITAGLTVGGNTWIYGNLYVIGTQTNVTNQTTVIGRTVIALSTQTTPAILANGSGITVGPTVSPYISFLYNGTNGWSSAGNLLPSVTNNYNLGSSAYIWNYLYANNAIISSPTQALSTNSGALQVTGGVGIGRNLIVGGQVLVSNPTQATNTQTGAVIIQGGLGVGGNLYAGNIYSNGVLVGSGGSGGGGGINNTVIYAGNDITVITSGTTGSFLISDISTLQTVTGRGATTNNQIAISNATLSYSTFSGALTVLGGVGVGDSVNIGNYLTVSNGATFYGTQTAILTSSTVFSGNILELHYNTTSWSVSNTKDIGLAFDYYNGSTSTQAFIGRANDSGYLEWYNTGTVNANGNFIGSYGTFKTGAVVLTSTDTSLTAAGGLYASSATISGTIYAGPIFSNGAPILTSASFANFGVATIIAGTGTAVSTSTGNVVIWNVSSLQSVTSNGNTTNQNISITNNTASVNSQTGAITVTGGVGIQGSLNVGNHIYAPSLTTDIATVTNLTVGVETVTSNILVQSSKYYPIQIQGQYNTTSSYYSANLNSGTNAYSAYTLQNDIGNYVEIGLNSSNRSVGNYTTGSAYIYTSPNLSVLNIGNSSTVNFYTEGIFTGNPPAMSIGANTTTIINSLLVEDNSYSSTPYATLNIQSNARISYSSLTLSNSSLNGQSFTFDVGGSNRAGQNGSAVNEGNFTLRDNVAGAYRFIVSKNSGNILINTTTDNGVNTLQINGSVTATNLVIASTATFNGSVIHNNTATFNGTATFNNMVIVGSSMMQTAITVVNTTNPTIIDSFDSTLYRSAKSIVQIEDGNTFYMVEIVLLHDNSGNVYISQYGIIATGSPLGDFTTALVSGQMVLYFTGYDTTAKTINVVRTAINV